MSQRHANIVAGGEAVLYGEGNSHENEWDTLKPYLGISTLVKNPAAWYAKKVIERIDDDVHPWWGSMGNWLCQQALQPITDHRECQTRVDMGPYDRVGHFDGCTFRDEHGNAVGINSPDVHYATIEEGKAHATVQEHDAVELAWRQGVSYAVDIEAQLEQGCDHLPLAPFHKPRWDPWAKPIEKWPNGVEVEGVNVFVFPRFGPSSITDEHRQIKPYDVTRSEKVEFRRWLDKKTASVWDSWAAGCDDSALAYDRSPAGITEFHRNIFEPPVVRDLEAERLAFELAEAKQVMKDSQKVVKGRHEAALKAILSDRGSISPNGKKVSAIVGANLVEARHPALTHLSVKPA